MSLTAASLVKCEVHLPHTHFYPGDAVEGAVVIDAAAAFDVFNVHIKIVGKEEVYAMVDQVKQSKIKNVQFGISSQDYVYYREIVTLAGALMTQKMQKKDKQNDPMSSRNDNEEDEDDNNDVDDFIHGDEPMRVNGDDDDGEECNYIRYNESTCVRPGVEAQNRSFAVSQIATEEGVSVRFPAGHYVYPFRFLLPTALPPNYDTGICVKDSQYSNSQAALHYYVKVYVWSPKRVQLASARADFNVGAMQPEYGASIAPTAAAVGKKSDDDNGNASSSTSAGSRARLPSGSAAGKSAHCVFPIMGTCSCFATDAKLKVTFTLASESLQIGRDCVTVSCAVAHNTSEKAIRGLRIQLVQVLKFSTTDALVTMRKVIVDTEVQHTIAPGKSGTINGSTKVLNSQADLMPTMKTSGLDVSYLVRVELLAMHVDQAYYEFEGLQLAGAMLAGAVPPVGPMRFTALPRGRLTKREAYYAIPMNPPEKPIIAALVAPLSQHSSRAVSRRASRLNSAAVTPK